MAAATALKEAYEARMRRLLSRQSSSAPPKSFTHMALVAAGVPEIFLAELPGLGLGSTTCGLLLCLPCIFSTVANPDFHSISSLLII